MLYFQIDQCIMWKYGAVECIMNQFILAVPSSPLERSLTFCFFTDSWITKALISSQIIQHRTYVPSDQDKGKWGWLKLKYHTFTWRLFLCFAITMSLWTSPASRGPSIFLEKSGRSLPDLSRNIKGPSCSQSTVNLDQVENLVLYM